MVPKGYDCVINFNITKLDLPPVEIPRRGMEDLRSY
jgi:hypothetical protein